MSASTSFDRVVVTASGDRTDAPVDPRFGRAARLLLVDVASGRVERALDNGGGVTATQGAGVQAAEAVVRLGAGALITGHCGPKAFRALQAAGVAVFTGAEGTVAEALQLFRDGRLERAADADVHGHWV